MWGYPVLLLFCGFFLVAFLWKSLGFRVFVAFDESVESVVLYLRVVQGLLDGPPQGMLCGYFRGRKLPFAVLHTVWLSSWRTTRKGPCHLACLRGFDFHIITQSPLVN
jgi:hypothetical protein